MSDRTSAGIFADIFVLIDENIVFDEWKRNKVAKEFWIKSKEYDFSPSQMDIDSTLIRLELAERKVNPEYPDEGEVMVYGPEDERKF